MPALKGLFLAAALAAVFLLPLAAALPSDVQGKNQGVLFFQSAGGICRPIGTHKECDSKGSCSPSYGTGPDTCASDAQCSFVTSTTTTLLPPECPALPPCACGSGYECIQVNRFNCPAWSCVPNYCPAPPECNGNLLEIGTFPNGCIFYGCEVATTTTSGETTTTFVRGTTSTSTTTTTNPPFHNECFNTKAGGFCRPVKGAGTSACQTDIQCKPIHCPAVDCGCDLSTSTCVSVPGDTHSCGGWECQPKDCSPAPECANGVLSNTGTDANGCNTYACTPVPPTTTTTIASTTTSTSASVGSTTTSTIPGSTTTIAGGTTTSTSGGSTTTGGGTTTTSGGTTTTIAGGTTTTVGGSTSTTSGGTTTTGGGTTTTVGGTTTTAGATTTTAGATTTSAAPPSGSVCGDGVCDANEDCNSCSVDCSSCFAPTTTSAAPPSGSVCGDGVCDANEDCSTCSTDCGTCGTASCFLAGTLVQTASGGKPIESLRPGDEILSFQGSQMVFTKLRVAYTFLQPAYYVLTTDDGEVKVTGEHRFYVGLGEFKKVRDLAVGDVLYEEVNGHLIPHRLLGSEKVAGTVPVYNLELGEPHTFFANGFAVHNVKQSDSTASPDSFIGGATSNDALTPFFHAVVCRLFNWC